MMGDWNMHGMIMMMHYDVIRHVCVDWQRLVRYGSRVFGDGRRSWGDNGNG